MFTFDKKFISDTFEVAGCYVSIVQRKRGFAIIFKNWVPQRYWNKYSHCEDNVVYTFDKYDNYFDALKDFNFLASELSAHLILALEDLDI